MRPPRCGPRPHPCSRSHEALVESYRLARAAAYVMSETLDTQDEAGAEVPLFRDWLRPGWSQVFS